jgi:hypothetical protein
MDALIFKAGAFHATMDLHPEIATLIGPRKVVRKHTILQDRTVTYGAFLHQHPYVDALTRRLLKGGAAGLEAADTETTGDGAALAGSLRVAIEPAAQITLAAGTRLRLPTELTVQAGGVPLTLSAGLEVTLRAAAGGRLNEGARAVLEGGMTPAPALGAVFPLAGAKPARLLSVTSFVLSQATGISTPAGVQADLSAGTAVVLSAALKLTLPTGLSVTLLKRNLKPALYANPFETAYQPDSARVSLPYPALELDFTSGGAYSIYNWELFFHVPMTMAVHLSRNGRYAEAQRWFHYLFDPTDDSDGPTPERFWKVRPFQTLEVRQVEEIITNLATGADETLRRETVAAIEAWKDAPFRPHAVARFRQQAYMFKTVMAYLDNLIAWGDSLFRQDTGEAIDEAFQIYVLAANILGPRPQAVPRKASVRTQTYANLRADLKEFGTVLRDVEAELPFDLMPFPGEGSPAASQMASLRSIGQGLYFCVPGNPQLLGYWDTVADRLFKIRNSLNFQGIFRQLALFEPPIDPGALARAAAAGLDIASVVNGVNQPLPGLRFTFLMQKALDAAGETRSLGSNLLSAIEKEDGEAMALLRAGHERKILQAAEQVRYAQLQEAIKSREALLSSLQIAAVRYVFFEQQLGRSKDEAIASIPAIDNLDRAALASQAFAMTEPEVAGRDLEVDIATDVFSDVSGALSGGHIQSSNEVRATLFMEMAQVSADVANILSAIGAGVSQVPDFEANAEPMGGGASVSYGGKNLSNALGASAGAANALASRLSFEAARALRIDTYARRELDWAFQSNLAAAEINQILKQLRAAQLREAIADAELKNHRTQMKQAEEVEIFLNGEGVSKDGKVSNKALYTWLKRETRGLYNQAFQFAFDIARKAERAFQRELAEERPASFVQLGYMAGKEGLLAGERLVFDLRRMEMAWHEANRQEYELTRHVSLFQIAPMALVQLRATGRCTIKIPEQVFDLDGPGHYYRRLRSVSLTLPCVTGPYSSVNCTLTLLKSSIRQSPALGEGYARQGAEDGRFSDIFGSTQSIVASSGQADAGLFDVNAHPERVLPFEYAGAVSEWQITLPANPANGEPAAFDYQSISDVILHLRYTAREGGDVLRRAAMSSLREAIDMGEAASMVRLLSVRQDFPTAWAAFKSGPLANGQRPEIVLELTPTHYPYWAQGKLGGMARIDLIARAPGNGDLVIHDRAETVDANGNPVPSRHETLVREPNRMAAGRFTGGQDGLALPDSPITTLRLYPETRAIDDLWVAVSWTGAA